MVPIDDIDVKTYIVPTDSPETDGTFEWDKTTLVLVRVKASKKSGIGFTYCHAAAAELIREVFIPIIEGRNAFDGPALWRMMAQSVRNIGKPGLASCAISAVDMALWDLKAKLMDLPLFQLWGKARDSVEVYGSGGFISYSSAQLQEQIEGWKKQGITKFKIKIGRNEDDDLRRIRQVRQTIGPYGELFVDANGAYSCKQALDLSRQFLEYGVKWFEEPVSSDNLEGLRILRGRLPPGVRVAAGEYGYDIDYFRRMLEAGAVDVLQADATRCGGFTGFFQAAALAQAFHRPLSSHTAHTLHFHACLALDQVCHMEYFHDHLRIENLFFEGGPILKDGRLFPNPQFNSGLGIEFKEKEAQKYLFDNKEKTSEKATGKKRWAIPEGYIPLYSHDEGNKDLTSHEAICILNTAYQEAHVSLMIYFSDREPVGPYQFVVPAKRTRHIRLNDLNDPAPIPKGTEFSSLIESDVEIVVQHTRIDTRQSENALMTTIAFGDS